MIDITGTVKKLGIDLNKCAVFSSGVMQIKGIIDFRTGNVRVADDIDMMVTKELYNELFSNSEFEHIELPWGGYNLRKVIDGVKVDIIPKSEWSDENGNIVFAPTADEIIERAFKVDGVKFMSLDDLKLFKKAFGREKDLKDIESIEKWESENGENKFLR